MPCRIRKKRTWTHRLMLESMMHKRAAFVTLTFAETNLRLGLDVSDYGALPTVHRADVSSFMKRLRYYCEPDELRFFAVGEYGDDTLDYRGKVVRFGRPHYHLVIFGLQSCKNYVTRSLGVGECCANCDRVSRAWGKGHIFLGQLTNQSAGYVCGYATKKMTSSSDERLFGRHPEFIQMSRNPGIGVTALDAIAKSLQLSQFDAVMDDVPSALRHGASILPLGNTLTRKLRVLIGRCELAPPSTLRRIKDELSPLRQIAFDTSSSFASTIAKASEGCMINMEARYRLFAKRSKI